MFVRKMILVIAVVLFLLPTVGFAGEKDDLEVYLKKLFMNLSFEQTHFYLGNGKFRKRDPSQEELEEICETEAEAKGSSLAELFNIEVTREKVSPNSSELSDSIICNWERRTLVRRVVSPFKKPGLTKEDIERLRYLKRVILPKNCIEALEIFNSFPGRMDVAYWISKECGK